MFGYFFVVIVLFIVVIVLIKNNVNVENLVEVYVVEILFLLSVIDDI